MGFAWRDVPLSRCYGQLYAREVLILLCRLFIGRDHCPPPLLGSKHGMGSLGDVPLSRCHGQLYAREVLILLCPLFIGRDHCPPRYSAANMAWDRLVSVGRMLTI